MKVPDNSQQLTLGWRIKARWRHGQTCQEFRFWLKLPVHVARGRSYSETRLRHWIDEGTISIRKIRNLGPDGIEALRRLRENAQYRAAIDTIVMEMERSSAKSLELAIHKITKGTRAEKIQGAQTLGKSGTDGLRILEEISRRSEPEVRATAMIGFRYFHAESHANQALKRILEGLLDNDPAVRRRAVESLQPYLANHLQARQGLVSALDDESMDVRAQAILSLPDSGPAFESAISRLQEILENGEGLERGFAADVLSRNAEQTERAVPLLLNIVTNSDNETDIRCKAVQSLTNYKNAATQIIPVIAQTWLEFAKTHDKILVHKPDPFVIACAKAMGALGPSSLPHLMSGLKKEPLSDSAAAGIAELKEKASPAVPDLIKLAECEKPWLVKNATRALCHIGPAAREALPLLINRLPQEDEPHKPVLVHGLGMMGDKDALPHLIALLPGSGEKVQIAVMMALNRFGDSICEYKGEFLQWKPSENIMSNEAYLQVTETLRGC